MMHMSEIRTVPSSTDQAIRNQFLLEPTQRPVPGGSPPSAHLINMAETQQTRPHLSAAPDSGETDFRRLYVPADTDGYQVPTDVRERNLYFHPMLVDFFFAEGTRSKLPYRCAQEESTTIDRNALKTFARPVSDLDTSLVYTNILQARGVDPATAMLLTDTVRRIILPARFSDATETDRQALYLLSLKLLEMPIYVTR